MGLNLYRVITLYSFRGVIPVNDTALAWAVFFTAASALTAAPRFLGDRRLREVSLLFSLLLWIAALYTWAVGFTDTGLFALVYLHLAPMLLTSGLLLVELGEGLSKRDKYERVD